MCGFHEFFVIVLIFPYFWFNGKKFDFSTLKMNYPIQLMIQNSWPTWWTMLIWSEMLLWLVIYIMENHHLWTVWSTKLIQIYKPKRTNLWGKSISGIFTKYFHKYFMNFDLTKNNFFLTDTQIFCLLSKNEESQLSPCL